MNIVGIFEGPVLRILETPLKGPSKTDPGYCGTLLSTEKYAER